MTTPEQPEQRVSWAELFLDLVWVFAVTQVAGLIGQAHGLGELARDLLLFFPLWWGWAAVAILGNFAGARLEAARTRMMLFALALCGFTMSIAVPGAFAEHGLLFGVGYAVLRLLVWWGVVHAPGYTRGGLDPFLIGVGAGVLFVVGGLVPSPARLWVWLAAVVVEVASPLVLARSISMRHFESSHLPERFGLFLIIALGENVVAVGASAASGPLGAGQLIALALSFLIMVLVWWTYFHYGAPAARHSLATDRVQARIVRDVFSYAHYAHVVAIMFFAVGLKKLIAHPFEVPHELPALLLAPGAAVYLTVFCYTRWRMFGAPTVQRATAAASFVLVAVAAPHLPAMLTAALVALLLFGVNAFEAWRVHTERPLLLLRLPGRRTATQ